MLPNFTIGLNEAPVGIVPPQFVIACARNTVSPRKAELMLTTGKLFTSQEAFDIGLVDEIAPNIEEATNRCQNFLQSFSKIPSMARSLTKQNFRRETLEFLKNPKNRSEDAKIFTGNLLRPSTQEDIENYVAALKKK